MNSRIFNAGGVIALLRGAARRLGRDAVAAHAALAAFFILVSAFPFTMLLMTLVRLLPQGDAAGGALPVLLHGIMPKTLIEFIATVAAETNAGNTGALISVTIASALWSSSRGVFAILRAIDRINGGESRGYIALRAMSVLYTLIFSALLILALAALVFGDMLFGWDAGAETLPRYAVTALLLTLFFSMLYACVPLRGKPFRTVLPGAAASSLGWLAFSRLYSLYLSRYAEPSLYGSLTSAVLLMFWLYFCMYILLLGAELNSAGMKLFVDFRGKM